MSTVGKIDSNITGLAIAEESTIGVLGASPTWYPLEPNSYPSFGGQVTTVARNPINPSRQRKKGVVVNVNSDAAFVSDITQKNIQIPMQGMMFASFRRKAEMLYPGLNFEAVDANGAYLLNNYKVASATVAVAGSGYVVGDILTVVGGTKINGSAATLQVASVLTGGVVTVTVLDGGKYSIPPTSPVTVTGGTGTLATFNLLLTNYFNYTTGDLMLASGFTNSSNNGLRRVISMFPAGFFNFAVPGGVDTGTENITVTAHGLYTGYGPVKVLANGQTLPAPLAEDTPYWVIRVDANTIRLATTRALSIALTPINLTTTGAGGGNCRLQQYGFSTLNVAETVVADVAPVAAADMVNVGHQFVASDISITQASGYPTITSAASAFPTTLIPGELIYIGGDTVASHFATAADNGFARIRSVAVGTLTLDKTSSAIVTDAGTAKTIQIFYGRVLKNELGSVIQRRSYQIERQLGAPDDSQLNQIQSELVVGAVANEFEVDMPLANKVTVTMKFTGTNTERRDGVTGIKAGTRVALVDADAYNTTNDISRIKVAQVVSGNSCPSSLFSFVESMKITGNNNIKPDGALAVMGAFDMTAGTFMVGATLNAYFATVSAMDAVQNNLDMTLEAHFVKANAGVSFDLPLCSLGDGRPNVTQDTAIMIPLTLEAATAAKVDPTLDYTLMVVFWDYLPTVAG